MRLVSMADPVRSADFRTGELDRPAFGAVGAESRIWWSALKTNYIAANSPKPPQRDLSAGIGFFSNHFP